MKNILQKSYLLVISILFIAAGTTFAQDTVDVAPGFNVIQPAIDANPGKVIRLERGGIYTNDVSIDINNPTVIVGQKEPYDTPPALINMYTDPGQAGGAAQFQIYADLELHYLGFTGFTVGNEVQGQIFLLNVPNITWTLDHCTVQNAAYVYWAGKDSLTINWTNNTFMNIYDEGKWNHGFFGNWHGDYVDYNYINNTVIGARRVLDALACGPHGKQTFIHNTYIDLSGEIYYSRTNADFVAKDNIFYNTYYRGYVGERPQWGYGGDYTNNSLDSLEGNMIEFYTLADQGIDDNARDIHIDHNLRYTSDKVLDWQKRTTATYQPMFSDSSIHDIQQYGWDVDLNDPLWEVVENGTRTSGIDPQFVTDMDNVGILDVNLYFNEGYRDSTKRHEPWPPECKWFPINTATGVQFTAPELVWPIENYLNVKPTNQATWNIASDGYPIGDLNWFGPEVMAAWEAGSPNPLVSVEKEGNDIPTNFALNQNYPNPFNPTTKISYSIPVSGKVTLKVFNSIGEQVASLVNNEQAAGNYSVDFDASKFSSGIYVYKIQVNNFIASKKMVLLK